jgi:hypothetical protein
MSTYDFWKNKYLKISLATFPNSLTNTVKHLQGIPKYNSSVFFISATHSYLISHLNSNETTVSI